MEIPVGIKVIQYFTYKCCRPNINTHFWYKLSVFTLTFLSYMSYHASRKSLSVVKTYFTRDCEKFTPPPDLIINDTNRKTWCDWAPFDQPDASFLLGILDSAFLFAYALMMFVSGFIADRVSLRYFLAIGMICSGASGYLFGIARSYNIHSLWYFIVVQIFGGVVQTTGWPGVVAVMGNWFGKTKRGLIFGIWNSHTSVGNIVGTLIATVFLEYNWGLSFIIPGVLIAFLGLINFLFLVESPQDINCDNPETPLNNPADEYLDPGYSSVESVADETPSDSEPLITSLPERRISRVSTISRKDEAIGFFGAFKIPGVIEFSLCLFFAKLVSYTFLYWLPYYINSSTNLSEEWSSVLSTIFDVGGIFGGIIAGAFSDNTGMSATTCAIMLIVSVPLLSVYNAFGSLHIWLNVILLALVGFFVNGPYALITTAVSAELGTHRSLKNNSKALATVTAIIDGTGSIGAAVGPLLAGVVYKLGWNEVFYMLIFSDIMALMMLLRLVVKEYKKYFTRTNQY